MHILSTRGHIGGLAAIIVAVLVYFFVTHVKEDEAEPVTTIEDATTVVLSTSSIPVLVSGVIEATDRAIIAAEAAGVIERLYVKEGSVVSKGTPIASQATPVADATAALRQAEAGLTDAEQTANVDVARSVEEQAAVAALSAQEIAQLNTLSTDARVAEAAVGMLVVAEANVSVILDALQFVSEHRTLFDDNAFPAFREVVSDLYGSIPDHFQGGVRKTVRSESDLRAFVEELAAQEVLSAVDVQNLYGILETENAALLKIYGAGEADILDRQLIEPSSTVYKEYFTQRAAISAARADLVAQNAALQTAIDTAAATKVDHNTTVTVSDLERAAAERQAAFSAAIGSAAGKVASAAISVAAAQRSLGDVQAPFAGVVVKRFKEVGEYANPGEPLVELKGVAGSEVIVSVPLILAPSLEKGQGFIVNGEVAGVVDRFSPVASGNVVSVVVMLTSDVYATGSTISGTLMLSGNETVFAVPRSYVQFGSGGAFVEEKETGDIYAVSIAYDAGEQLYVTLHDGTPKRALRPAYSIAL